MISWWLIIFLPIAAWGLFYFFRSRRKAGFAPGTREGRILQEDALKHLYKSEQKNRAATVQSLGGQVGISADRAAEVLAALGKKELVRPQRGDFRLTSAGRDYALHVIRSHRLLERYLADKTGLRELDWHTEADRLEHELTPEAADALSSELGNPTHDPHGDPLPTPEGEWAARRGVSALQLDEGQVARVIHVEDEPESVYSQLLEAGIFPGMIFRVNRRSSDEFEISVEGSLTRIGNVAAGNLTVVPLEASEEPDFQSVSRLNELKRGEAGRVVMVSRAARETERRRFMDLGILPGARIHNEFTGPSGDPTAYRVRGALIALRREQAAHVFVTKEDGSIQ